MRTIRPIVLAVVAAILSCVTAHADEPWRRVVLGELTPTSELVMLDSGAGFLSMRSHVILHTLNSWHTYDTLRLPNQRADRKLVLRGIERAGSNAVVVAGYTMKDIDSPYGDSAVAYVSKDGGRSWTYLLPPKSGRYTDIDWSIKGGGALLFENERFFGDTAYDGEAVTVSTLYLIRVSNQFEMLDTLILMRPELYRSSLGCYPEYDVYQSRIAIVDSSRILWSAVMPCRRALPHNPYHRYSEAWFKISDDGGRSFRVVDSVWDQIHRNRTQPEEIVQYWDGIWGRPRLFFSIDDGVTWTYFEKMRCLPSYDTSSFGVLRRWFYPKNGGKTAFSLGKITAYEDTDETIAYPIFVSRFDIDACAFVEVEAIDTIQSKWGGWTLATNPVGFGNNGIAFCISIPRGPSQSGNSMYEIFIRDGAPTAIGREETLQRDDMSVSFMTYDQFSIWHRSIDRSGFVFYSLLGSKIDIGFQAHNGILFWTDGKNRGMVHVVP